MQVIKEFINFDVFPDINSAVYRVLMRDLLYFIEIQKTLGDGFSVNFQKLLLYHQAFHHLFLELVLEEFRHSNPTLLSKEIISLEETRHRLERNLHELYARLSIDRIFDIVLDFPDSLNVIVELKETIDKTNTLHELSERLQNELKTRLLIPGVITQYIINQYINILKVLQILDPSGIVFGEQLHQTKTEISFQR